MFSSNFLSDQEQTFSQLIFRIFIPVRGDSSFFCTCFCASSHWELSQHWHTCGERRTGNTRCHVKRSVIVYLVEKKIQTNFSVLLRFREAIPADHWEPQGIGYVPGG